MPTDGGNLCKSRDVTFVTATDQQRADIIEFLHKEFIRNEPMAASLNPSEREFDGVFADIVGICLKDSCTTLAYHDGKIIGLLLGAIKYHDKAEFPKRYSGIDFTEEITKGPYKNRNENRIATFLDVAEAHQDELLGEDAKIFKIEIICVAVSARGLGIAKELMRLSFEKARSEGCDWMAAVATAVASQSLFAKLGFETFFEVPFVNFRENGQPVFRDVPDGGRSAKFIAIRLN
ncbi:hypothetical protein Q1695_014698 [Nippostrongylus brasiliensis]|nr:hypothetical protein Q1695_014698 [Nippostrongylus brasiliensis]